MHKRPKAELLPLETKLERTLINFKKVRVAEETVMAKHREGNQNIHVVATNREPWRIYGG